MSNEPDDHEMSHVMHMRTTSLTRRSSLDVSLPDETAATSIRTVNLSVAYGSQLVLKNVSVDFPSGAVMGIVGPNGAGKSTLIKAMLGLVPTLTGHTEFFGTTLKAARGRVGYMPQRSSIDWDFPCTVSGTVLMGTYGKLGWFRRPGAAERQAAQTAIEQVGLTDVTKRQIGQLSGGQRQRVLLARTLATTPDVLFLDEPFAGVDAVSQNAIIDVLHRLREAGKTVALVHHDLATVSKYCDHVTLVNGQVVASGPVAEAFTADNVRATYEIADAAHPFLQEVS